MSIDGSKFVNFAICGLLSANVVFTISIARYGRLVISYRDDVSRIAVDVYNYVSDTEARFASVESNLVSCASSSLHSLQSTSADYQKTIGHLPYRYSVVRGHPGIAIGPHCFYAVGHLTAYGIITAVGPDFVEFDGSRRYVIGVDSTDSPLGG